MPTWPESMTKSKRQSLSTNRRNHSESNPVCTSRIAFKISAAPTTYCKCRNRGSCSVRISETVKLTKYLFSDDGYALNCDMYQNPLKSTPINVSNTMYMMALSFLQRHRETFTDIKKNTVLL